MIFLKSDKRTQKDFIVTVHK